jgi:hypothetical protein
MSDTSPTSSGENAPDSLTVAVPSKPLTAQNRASASGGELLEDPGLDDEWY